MKKLKKLLISFMMMGTLALPACGGGLIAPDQSEVNAQFQDLIFDLEELVFFLDFFNLIDCPELQALIDDIVGTVACDDDGSSTIAVTNFDCDEGPPLTASFDITQTNDNCEELGETTEGSVGANTTFDGNTINMAVSSSGITANGLTFIFSNLLVIFDPSLIPTCSGDSQVNGETCSANAACTECTLN